MAKVMASATSTCRRTIWSTRSTSVQDRMACVPGLAEGDK